MDNDGSRRLSVREFQVIGPATVGSRGKTPEGRLGQKADKKTENGSHHYDVVITLIVKL